MHGLLAELGATVSVGAVLRGLALSAAAVPATLMWGSLLAQSLSFLLLMRLVIVIELSWTKIGFVCRAEQFVMGMMLVTNMLMQAGFISSTGELSTLQLAALAALISLRLRLIAFFEFKALRPMCAFCKPAHLLLPHCVTRDRSLAGSRANFAAHRINP